MKSFGMKTLSPKKPKVMKGAKLPKPKVSKGLPSMRGMGGC
jgi:hypothetical protein